MTTLTPVEVLSRVHKALPTRCALVRLTPEGAVVLGARWEDLPQDPAAPLYLIPQRSIATLTTSKNPAEEVKKLAMVCTTSTVLKSHAEKLGALPTRSADSANSITADEAFRNLHDEVQAFHKRVELDLRFHTTIFRRLITATHTTTAAVLALAAITLYGVLS